MSRLLQIAIIGLAALATSLMARADDCEFTADRTATIDTAGAKRIDISARAGELFIEGAKGGPVEARGRACASEQEYIDQIKLESRREGDTVYLEVRMPDTEKHSGWGSNYATLDLRVTVPDSIPLRVTDSSGEAEVRNVKALNMTDSSGELRITNVPGDIEVRDSSGELWIRNVGSLRLSDSSGDVEIEGVEGDVKIDVDSSGSLEIENVKGKVQIDQDSSGDIRIVDVGGDVRIDSDSSGSVDVRRVGGAFALGTKGSGSIQVADVKGTVTVPPGR